MRVVAGSARGRRLKSPKGNAIRPTSDRARESIFNMLESRDALRDAVVVDLFAGTGALGIEALSRGAASAVFVDSDAAAVRLVHENLLLTGLAGAATVVREDVPRFVARGATAGATLVLADPPYAFDGWEVLLESLGDALFVAEADHEVTMPEAWEVLAVRRYGGTVVTLARRKGVM